MRERLTQFAMIAVVAILAVANMMAFYINLRRYAVGRYGPKLFFLHNQGWSPPTGQFLTLAVFGLVTTVFAGVLMWWLWWPSRPSEPRQRSHRNI
jgi:hypothetical protein